MNLIEIRKKVFYNLEEHDARGFWANLDDALLTIASMGMVLITCILTFPASESLKPQLHVATLLFALIFVGEFILKIWSSGDKEEYRGFWGKVRLLKEPDDAADIVAMVHSLFLATGIINNPLQVLNLLFVFHFVKISRYVRTIREGLKAIHSALRLMVPVFVILIPILLVDSYIFYITEHATQPEKFANLGDGLWFAIVTATTVGYGDLSPVTWVGRIATSLHMIFAIGLFGALAAVIAIKIALTFKHNGEDKSTDTPVKSPKESPPRQRKGTPFE